MGPDIAGASGHQHGQISSPSSAGIPHWNADSRTVARLCSKDNPLYGEMADLQEEIDDLRAIIGKSAP
jgi:hypothetical protein